MGTMWRVPISGHVLNQIDAFLQSYVLLAQFSRPESPGLKILRDFEF